MRCTAFWVAISLAATVTLPLAAQGDEEAWTFRPAAGFFQLPSGQRLGQCSGVASDAQGNVYVFHRGKTPVLCFDAQGKLIRGWGDDLIGSAHGMRFDARGNLWVTDIGRHRVLQFSPDGKLLLALGKDGQPGSGTDQFDKPTDIAFGPQGEIYVSDGYGNSRVMKFSAEGKFLKTWGQAGKAPGEFHLPHSIRTDPQGNVYVGDRENNRVQVFDPEGKLTSIWTGFAPYGLAWDRQGHMLVADGRANRILRLDERGQVVGNYGSKGTLLGHFQMPHGIDVDAAGNVFVAEVTGTRVQKLVPAK